MKFIRTIVNRARPEGRPEGRMDEVPQAAPEQVAAAADFQKTMGRDRITGLPHRACFSHVLNLQSQIATQLETRLSVIVLEWPDYAAHEDPIARDRALNRMASAMRDALHRTHDVLGSLGDGRLAAMLPFTDGAGADVVARNLQAAAGAALRPAPPAPEVTAGEAGEEPDAEDAAAPANSPDPATPETEAAEPPAINVGIAAFNGKGGLTHGALLAAAERAVHYAAINGGDRVVRFDPGAETMRS